MSLLEEISPLYKIKIMAHYSYVVYEIFMLVVLIATDRSNEFQDLDARIRQLNSIKALELKKKKLLKYRRMICIHGTMGIEQVSPTCNHLNNLRICRPKIRAKKVYSINLQLLFMLSVISHSKRKNNLTLRTAAQVVEFSHDLLSLIGRTKLLLPQFQSEMLLCSDFNNALKSIGPMQNFSTLDFSATMCLMVLICQKMLL